MPPKRSIHAVSPEESPQLKRSRKSLHTRIVRDLSPENPPQRKRPKALSLAPTSPSDDTIVLLGSNEIDKNATAPLHPSRSNAAPAFEIKASLSARYSVYPQKLRAELERRYVNAVRVHMSHAAAGHAADQRVRYDVVHGICLRPSAPTFRYSLVKEHIGCLCAANVVLLEHFLSRNEGMFGPKLPAFVPLKTQEGLANPAFVHLHSVRYGEVGCGFDCWGALSLYTTRPEGRDVRVEVTYVVKANVKVEQED